MSRIEYRPDDDYVDEIKKMDDLKGFKYAINGTLSPEGSDRTGKPGSGSVSPAGLPSGGPFSISADTGSTENKRPA